ncbi:hypothetical protein F2Q70_00019690 [Brassica cretica]|uniref:mitogen-activated protein kinase n=1 Tax=Brassica cretica TaxID=69181 RepID=A0A8S9GP63_BRACR|nr:hypothetical protein F2Q70_00019690 [Brassica cretica]
MLSSLCYQIPKGEQKTRLPRAVTPPGDLRDLLYNPKIRLLQQKPPPNPGRELQHPAEPRQNGNLLCSEDEAKTNSGEASKRRALTKRGDRRRLRRSKSKTEKRERKTRRAGHTHANTRHQSEDERDLLLCRPKREDKIERGLKYIHSANILHRDLKPGNLLINANCDLKICDFGLARTSNTKGQFMTEYVVTRWYRAPELLLCCDNYGTSIDVWSVGCIFAELLGRKPIFQGTECLNQLKLIVNILGSQRDEDLEFIDNPKAKRYIRSLPYSPGMSLSRLYPGAHVLAIDLLQKMLVFDPSKRISVTEALQHPYMAPLYDPNANPPAQVPIDLDVDEELGEEMIREMMWNEMLHYHPQATPSELL